MKPEYFCVVCGEPDSPYMHRDSWGPITHYYHYGACETEYRDRVRPRLRDAILHAMDRWRASRGIPKEHNRP